MSDATITALMEELREVDFATWKDIRFLLGNVGMDNGPREIPLEQHIYQDLILGCILRAIAERPDHWIISQWMSQDKWQAMIRCGPRGYTDPEYMHIGEGDIPAAAILAAYIEAVRARQ